MALVTHNLDLKLICTLCGGIDHLHEQQHKCVTDDTGHIIERCNLCGCQMEYAGPAGSEDDYYGFTCYEAWYCPVCDNAAWQQVWYPGNYFDGDYGDES